MIKQELPIHYYTLTLGELCREGDALAEISQQDEDGEIHTQTVRVPAGLPGERVSIAVESPPLPPKKRKRHWKLRSPRVWITEIHEPSPDRVYAPCGVFGICGGCQLQHLRYDRQIAWKNTVVTRLLEEIGHFERPPMLPTVPCDDPWNYRNHMRFSVNRDGVAGLTARGTHRVLPLTDCPIADDMINVALKTINSEQVNPRPQVLIRYGTKTGQMLMHPTPSEKVSAILTDPEVGIEIRSETMEEHLMGETFRIRPSSFFQTNTPQANKMAEMVLAGLFEDREAQPDLTLVDAYCGVGTFAMLLARRAARVIAIEESPSAITDAQWNLRSAPNVEIIKAKVEEVLPAMAHQINGLVIDPPRAGCQRDILEALARHPVGRIVYVSCEPSTLARDLDILCHEFPAYRLRTVQPLDMFPQTAHIETVAVLEQIPADEELA